MAAASINCEYRTISSADVGLIVGSHLGEAVRYALVVEPARSVGPPDLLYLGPSAATRPLPFDVVKVGSHSESFLCWPKAVVRPDYSTLSVGAKGIQTPGALIVFGDVLALVAKSDQFDTVAFGVEDGRVADPPSKVAWFKAWEIGHFMEGGSWETVARFSALSEQG